MSDNLTQTGLVKKRNSSFPVMDSPGVHWLRVNCLCPQNPVCLPPPDFTSSALTYDSILWIVYCYAKMGSIKDRYGRDLTEAEDIKKRWQEYTEGLYKKDLHDPDNHDGVVTHLESDILECKVKWALGSITMNKASGGDRIPVELFQILKDDAVKVLHSICQQIWKTQQWPQDWKGQLSFQTQRKEMPKNVQTTTQLHSSHTLVN